ncbi:Proline--tRNA ligase [Azospirillaceae bacterium]
MNIYMSNKKSTTAVTPTRSENFNDWYQAVIKAADMAESARDVRGCMVIKPWGYGIWELIQRDLDRRIKETGHDNAYFPLFIPLSYFEKEARHVDGFAKEMAVVTHHRLVSRDGKLVPDGELEEPYVVRPTSETIIGAAFSRWVKSYRDLPVLINQWANVVRWEMRPRIFLRTAEFLWQEGHTAHVSESEAREETMRMLDVYRAFAEEVLALPVITGEKPPHERFPGADDTYCIEAMMQDGKALQAGTSHYLGQHFAKASNIVYQSAEGGTEHAYTTSWGVSTRLIGGVIMAHADDNGLRLPPRIAPRHIALVPIIRNAEDASSVEAFIKDLEIELKRKTFAGEPVRVIVDRRDIPSVEKRWQWVKKGTPIVCEIGPKDVAKGSVAAIRRDGELKAAFIPRETFIADIEQTLGEIQDSLFKQAKTYTESRIVSVSDPKAFREMFSGEDSLTRCFVRAKWSGDPATLAVLDEMGVTVRCIPFDQDGEPGTCILSGVLATRDAIFAKAY